MSFEQDDITPNQLPPYDDKAWEKMEALLDEHLPQKKKRRRILWWWLLPLMLAGLGGVYLAVNNGGTTTRQNQLVADQPGTVKDSFVLKQPPVVEETVPASDPSIQKGDNVLPRSGEDINSREEKNNTIVDQPVASKKSKNLSSSDRKYRQPGTTKGTNKNRETKDPDMVQTFTGPPSIKTDTETTAIAPVQKNIPDNDIEQIPDTTVANGTILISDSIGKQQDSLTVVLPDRVEKESKQPSRSQNRGITFYLSAGPDISYVSFQQGGKLRAQYGFGVGYGLSNRLSVRTGFYVSSKVYKADSADYNPPEGFWNYYPNLQRIDADCRVYEIPLNLLYYFPANDKHQWFVSAGVSSYIMKRETYGYDYKNSLGEPRYNVRHYENENQHWLGVAGLSGGYQYLLNKKIAFMAEPYIRLPLRGVGYGKVKLQSAGLQLSIRYQPFHK